MTQIVNAHALQACGPAHRSPGLLEVRARRTLLCAGDDMQITFNARNVRKHLLRCRGKIEWLFTGLAVGEENQPALDVDLLPFGV